MTASMLFRNRIVGSFQVLILSESEPRFGRADRGRRGRRRCAGGVDEGRRCGRVTVIAGPMSQMAAGRAATKLHIHQCTLLALSHRRYARQQARQRLARGGRRAAADGAGCGRAGLPGQAVLAGRAAVHSRDRIWGMRRERGRPRAEHPPRLPARRRCQDQCAAARSGLRGSKG